MAEEQVSIREILLPLRTVSESNARDHWRTRARRAKEQRAIARSMSRMALAGGVESVTKGEIRLTRIGPRALDGDNLQGALKAIRDGVADALKIDDGDPRLSWVYAQERGDYGVRVEVELYGA